MTAKITAVTVPGLETHGPYRFNIQGREVSVTVYVDPAKIAAQMVRKAFENASGISKKCDGAVMVECTEYTSKQVAHEHTSTPIHGR